MIILEKIKADTAIIYIDDVPKEVPLSAVKCRREGSVLTVKDGVFTEDEQATEERHRYILSLQNGLWE